MVANGGEAWCWGTDVVVRVGVQLLDKHGRLGCQASRCGEWGQSSQKYTGRGGVEKAGVRITGWTRGGLGWSEVERETVYFHAGL